MNNKPTTKQKSLTPTQILKRPSSVSTQLSQELPSSSQKKELIQQSKPHGAALTSAKIPKSTSSSTNIAMIGAAAYRMLAKRSDVKTFAVTVSEIDRLITTAENKPEGFELSHAEALEQVKAKLPSEYHDYLDVFDRAMADQLPPHRSYDQKIELTGEGTPPRSRLYQMSGHKLQKVKEYLTEHLNKGFISSSSALYASPILFAEKKEGTAILCPVGHI